MEHTALNHKWPPPSIEEIEAIINFDDLIVRNLKITQAYHELTVGLTALVGDKNVNWCGQATWASKTAGIFIRKEQLSDMIEFYLKDSPVIEQLLWRLNRIIKFFTRSLYLDKSFIFTVIKRITDEISNYVSQGNHIVFQELAPLYSRMYSMFLNSTTYDQSELDDFLSHLTPGHVDDGGQDKLIKAFTHYYEAMFEENSKIKAELILLANLLVGYHEQIRLQKPIVNAMESPLDKVFEDIFFDNLSSLIKTVTLPFISKLIISIARKILRVPLRTVAHQWRETTTQWTMTLKLPHETLELDKDIPSLKSGKMFPPELTTVDNIELLDILSKLDRTVDTTTGSAARDWGKLDDRMNFIADLFRSRQQDSSLYEQPFTDEQVETIHKGEKPDGEL